MGKSIQRSQAELLAANFLQKLGQQRAPVTNLPIVEQFLAEYALIFQENIDTNLAKKKTTVKGHLNNDQAFDITKAGTVVELNIGYPADSEAATYYDFVNKGVKGADSSQSKSTTSPYGFKSKYPSKKMATAILLWVRQNAMMGRNEDQTKNLSSLQQKRKSFKQTVTKTNDFKSLAYAISTSIKTKGLKETLYFDDALRDTFLGFQDAMQAALGGDIRLTIRQLNNGNNN
jgi:hypothetical protein